MFLTETTDKEIKLLYTTPGAVQHLIVYDQLFFLTNEYMASGSLRPYQIYHLLRGAPRSTIGIRR